MVVTKSGRGIHQDDLKTSDDAPTIGCKMQTEQKQEGVKKGGKEDNVSMWPVFIIGICVICVAYEVGVLLGGGNIILTTAQSTESDTSIDIDTVSNIRNEDAVMPDKFNTSAKKEEDQGDVDELPPGQCALYLAKSSLPHAGLGLYSGIAAPYGSSLNEYVGGFSFSGDDDDDDDEEEEDDDDDTDAPLWTDLFVPLSDLYKALPYRGQQRFPSWLQYIWPEEPGALSDSIDGNKPFPDVPPELFDFDTGLNYATGLKFYMDDLNDQIHALLPDFLPRQRVSAFVPGIASLANHAGWYANIDRIGANSRSDFDGQEAPWHAGAGAFTPHHRVEFIITDEEGLVEGQELLIDYGQIWHNKNEKKLLSLANMKKKNRLGHRARKGFVNGIDKKWDHLDAREHGTCPEELPTEKAKREGLAHGMARDSSEFEDGFRPYSEYRENNYHPSEFELEENDDVEEDTLDTNVGDFPMKPLSWLDQNGVCVSSGLLKVGSSPIRYAGRGVFATQIIRKGSVIMSSPLLAMRREDFTIYKSNPEEVLLRDIVDTTKVVGTELLLNYAFTHPNSPLYLIPSGPMVNYINHGGRKNANVEIRWPKDRSNTAKLFEWAYNQERSSHFDNDFETKTFVNPNPWLKDHPIDVMERSGKLAFEYVALRDIKVGDEILIDYGELWEDAWLEFSSQHPYARSGYFRHAIGVPSGFFPDNWMNVSDVYEIAEIQDLENKPLTPGEVVPMTWAHNGKPVGSKYAYIVGLQKGFSDKFLEYSEKQGVIELYRKLLTEQEGYHLGSDAFDVYKPGLMTNISNSESDKLAEFFAHRYNSINYKFNMHFVAPWNEVARKNMLTTLGDTGFDLAIKGIGERFGYDNMTCFLGSYMGVTHCDKAKMHSDIYATNDKSWNIVFPLITVNGTDPELNIMSEDMNTAIGVNYLKDVAYAIGDFGYHQTRPIKYYDPDEDDTDDDDPMVANGVPIRVVFGAYCSQVDETNVAMLRHIYDGDDPAPFADQFKDLPMKEIHWDRDGKSTLAQPSGEGYAACPDA